MKCSHLCWFLQFLTLQTNTFLFCHPFHVLHIKDRVSPTRRISSARKPRESQPASERDGDSEHISWFLWSFLPPLDIQQVSTFSCVAIFSTTSSLFEAPTEWKESIKGSTGKNGFAGRKKGENWFFEAKHGFPSFCNVYALFRPGRKILLVLKSSFNNKLLFIEFWFELCSSIVFSRDPRNETLYMADSIARHSLKNFSRCVGA